MKKLSVGVALAALVLIGGSYVATAGLLYQPAEASPSTQALNSLDSTSLSPGGVPAASEPARRSNFIQRQTILLSGSPFYEPLANVSLKAPPGGLILVQASGTITATRAGTYADLGLSMDADSVVWAHRAGMPQVQVAGSFNWPFSVAQLFEVTTPGEHTFYLNGRQLGASEPVIIDLGSMYALWIASPEVMPGPIR